MNEVRLGNLRIIDRNLDGLYESKADEVIVDPGLDYATELTKLGDILGTYGSPLLEGQSLSRMQFFYHYSKAFECSRKGEVDKTLTHVRQAEFAAALPLSHVEIAGFYGRGLQLSLRQALVNAGPHLHLWDMGRALTSYLNNMGDEAGTDEQEAVAAARALLDKLQAQVESEYGNDRAAEFRVKAGIALLAEGIRSANFKRRAHPLLGGKEIFGLFQDSLDQAISLSADAEGFAQDQLTSDFSVQMLFLAMEGLEKSNFKMWRAALWWTAWACAKAGHSPEQVESHLKRTEAVLLSAFPDPSANFILTLQSLNPSWPDANTGPFP